MICIVFNIITMALTYEGSPPSYDAILEDINYFFTAVFICECILKVIGMGHRAYWYSGWNKFDFFVVSTSVVDILMSTVGNGFSFLKVGPQLARVFRVLRVSRLLKLVKSLRGIQKLLETLMLALPALMNVGALLFLVFFVFAVLGVFLFQDITSGVIIDDLNNFTNFNYAIVLLFRCSTGESWWSFMFDTYAVNPYAPLFWIPFMVVGSFIMLNLFILVILDEFEKYSKKGDSPHTVFKDTIGEFRKNWSALTRNTQGTHMPARILIDFFKMLQPDLGFGKEARREMVAKEIMKMNIVGDENYNVYFNEVLYGALKRVHGDLEWTTQMVARENVKVKVKLNPFTQKMITEQELNTKKKIDKLKIDLIRKEMRKNKRFSRSFTSKKSSLKQQNSLFKDLEMKSSNNLMEQSETTFKTNGVSSSKKKVYLNPLVTILFVGMTFKSWINFMKKVKTGELQNDDIIPEDSYNSENDDDDDSISQKSDSFLAEDVFNEEEQKDYEEKTQKPKIPKKNLLEYDEKNESGIEEEESPDLGKPQENLENDNNEEEQQENKEKKNKPILRNARMSAFGTLEKKNINEKKRNSMRDKEIKDHGEKLISEERDVQESEESR